MKHQKENKKDGTEKNTFNEIIADFFFDEIYWLLHPRYEEKPKQDKCRENHT